MRYASLMTEENFRTVLVANPNSQNGALGRKWSQLSAVIAANFGPFHHRFTRGVGDGTLQTRAALDEGYEMVVAMGGDGTISEVVDGFFDHRGPRRAGAVLGVLHFGTGGDFRRTIAAPTKLADGARALRGRATTDVDVGRLTYVANDGSPAVRHFANIASFGIGGLVDKFVNESSKALGGRISFAVATLRAMRRYSPQRARIRLDGGAPREVTLQNVAVANGQYFGGGMHIAPTAKLDDGLFDVVALGPLSLGDMVFRGHKVYSGTHLEMPQVSLAQARQVDAEPVDPGDEILLDVDGETPGRLPARFELLPRALRLKSLVLPVGGSMT
ncbi:MAG: diacylglycerol kinase family lipid kinase [Deltaproteobacteria bacterium]|nr:diacylglycerol kinase family lipid kinase [Deltaproteobacteria bacterium]